MAARVLENHHNHGKKNLARVRNTVLAEQDLEEIWLYIAADNIVAADALLDKLVAKSVLLASNPELGRSRPEIHEGLRSVPVGNYILSIGRSPVASSSRACCTALVISTPYGFRRNAIDATNQFEDPIDLFSVRLGGSADINGAVVCCQPRLSTPCLYR